MSAHDPFMSDDLPEFERINALNRMERITRLLREDPYSIRQLAEILYPDAPLVDRAWLRVQRSIQRDIERLNLFNVGIQKLGGRPPRYHIPQPAEALRDIEVLAVHAALRLMSHHSPAHNEHYHAALQKLSRQLPQSVQQSLSTLPPAPTRAQENDNLEKIAQAWMQGRTIRFEYGRSRHQAEPGCELEVYYVEVNRQNLATYVIGRELKRDAIRTLKLSRMWFVTLTDRHYEIPGDFNPASVLGGAWGVIGNTRNATTLTLRFTPDAAYRVIEGGYPGMSEPEIHPDGSIIVTVEAGLDNTGLPREVLPWIYSWGPRVQVLAPENVRQHWLNELRAALENASMNDVAKRESVA